MEFKEFQQNVTERWKWESGKDYRERVRSWMNEVLSECALLNMSWTCQGPRPRALGNAFFPNPSDSAYKQLTSAYKNL